jgi:hypothetical protein
LSHIRYRRWTHRVWNQHPPHNGDGPRTEGRLLMMDHAVAGCSVGVSEGYNICRRPDTTSVEEDRHQDGPFFVAEVSAFSDDSEVRFWYTANKSHTRVRWIS